MKPPSLFGILLMQLAALALPLAAQPVKLWEVKISDLQLAGFSLDYTGQDGSAILRTSVGGPGSDGFYHSTNHVFWISPDAQQINDIVGDSWPDQTSALYLSSDRLLIRVDEQGLANPSGALTLFSRTNGVISRTDYSLPGTPTTKLVNYFLNSSLLTFYTSQAATNGTFLTKWNFEGLSTPASLSIRSAGRGEVSLSATSDQQASLESSGDLRSWLLVTNFTGAIQIPVDTSARPHQMFRVE